MRGINNIAPKMLLRRFLRILFVLAMASILIAPGLGKITRFSLVAMHSTFHQGVVTKQGMGRMTGCRPYVRFIDQAGAEHEFKSRIIYHYFFCPQVGDSVSVFSERENPENAYIYNFTHHIFIPILLILTGIGVIYLALLRKPKLAGQFSLLPVIEKSTADQDIQNPGKNER